MSARPARLEPAPVRAAPPATASRMLVRAADLRRTPLRTDALGWRPMAQPERTGLVVRALRHVPALIATAGFTAVVCRLLGWPA